MQTTERQQHWENIYQTKPLDSVSWYQPNPVTSLDFIDQLSIQSTDKIIDVGGGDSFLTDKLLDRHYENLSVLDISSSAILRAKKRLGDRADKVQWIVSDVLDFQADQAYDLWHDRAAFHFLTDESDINRYILNAHQAVKPGGNLVVGTFSDQGPTKCSGIAIRQYSVEELSERFKPYFERISCLNVNHPTPSGSIQNFTFCSFRHV